MIGQVEMTIDLHLDCPAEEVVEVKIKVQNQEVWFFSYFIFIVPSKIVVIDVF